MTRTITRIAAVALATSALAAPSALARPDTTPAPRHAAITHFVTRPVIDRNPVAPSTPSSRPVTVSVATTDRGSDSLTLGIGIVASLLAAGAAGIAVRVRRSAHPHVAA